MSDRHQRGSGSGEIAGQRLTGFEIDGLDKTHIARIGELTPGREDVILKLNEAARADTHQKCVRLVVGVPLDEDGNQKEMQCISVARSRIKPGDHSYGPIGGLPELVSRTEFDIFGANAAAVKEGRVASVVTAGGTHALFTAGRYLIASKANVEKTIYTTSLFWDNHPGIFENLDFKVDSSTMIIRRGENGRVDFAHFAEGLKKVPKGSKVLLQVCGNNPTGMDFNQEEWREIAKIMAHRGLYPVLDFAYHQLVKGVDEDAYPVRLFEANGFDFTVCYSYSKRYGTLGQRAGLISVVSQDKAIAETARSILRNSNRTSISQPPRYPQELILEVMLRLKEEHAAEVASLRRRLTFEREELKAGMAARGIDMPYVVLDDGFFTTFDQITENGYRVLKDVHHVHTVPVRDGSGAFYGVRFNLFGINNRNRDHVYESLADVIGLKLT